MQRNYWTVLNLLTSEHREAFRKPVRRPRNTQTIYSSIESDFLLIQVSNKSPGAESYIQLFPAHQEIKGFLETTDKIMNLDVSGHLLQDDTWYYPLSFEYCTCERGCTGRWRGSSHIFQNKMILWLSLVLNWIIKMDNSCSANFLQKPKETMNRLHDENCRRSQKAESVRCFTALRLRLGSISSVFAGFKEKNGWYTERERLTLPLHYGCTLMACKIPEYLFYTIKSSPETPFLPILNLYGRSLSWWKPTVTN